MRKIFLALACTVCGLSAPLFAQKTTPAPKTVSTPAKMTLTTQLTNQMVALVHETFPESKSEPAAKLYQGVRGVMQKAVVYGIDNEADLATYVLTSYILGGDFDEEVPEAGAFLRNPRYTSHQKATQLESWAQQAVEALENDDELARKVTGKQAEMRQAKPSAPEASPGEYLNMQAESKPYKVLADWAVARLRAGDAKAVMDRFSPNFMQHLGRPAVERAFREQMVPFFAGSANVGNGTTITKTHDGFGSEGFAFYFTLNGPEKGKPFVLYVVNEKGNLVVANIVLNKTYADIHP
jgi:hypothetical protein